MSERPELDVLRHSLLLHGMSSEDLERVARLLRRRSYRRGEVVFHRGDPGASLHLVYEGQLKVVVPIERGEEAVLTILGPGDFFGEITLLDGGPRSATIVALQDVRTATLDRADFLALLRASPATVEGLLAALAGKIRRMTDEITDLMFLDLRGRLAKKLLELAEAHGRTSEGEIEIQASLTQEELAGMIGATRPRVNKLLGFFEDQGAITRRGRRIVIRQPESLRWWVGQWEEL
jgi:CRP/FNR family transcriptional regulator, cyclic AMP receptor protein